MCGANRGRLRDEDERHVRRLAAAMQAGSRAPADEQRANEDKWLGWALETVRRPDLVTIFDFRGADSAPGCLDGLDGAILHALFKAYALLAHSNSNFNFTHCVNHRYIRHIVHSKVFVVRRRGGRS